MTPALPSAESLTVEFKSDRKRLPDSDLVEAIVCLANAEGGALWLGVEDDGTPTGLHVDHRNLAGLAGLVAARTSPSLRVQVEPVQVAGLPVACITVPKAQTVVATVGGVYLRRRLKHDGTPECAPMLPHERESRAASLGLVDVSAQPVAGATLADLDPLERERLRQAVQHYGGDRVLLELDDEALDGALGLTVYRAAGDKAGYTRQAGFTALQHEQMVLSYVRQHGQIKRAEVMELCRLSDGQAKKLLVRLRDEGQIIQHGERRGTYYTSGSKG